jgi:osmotically-inducible protein OsmY
MHHEHDLDYEREDDLRRREDDWGYGERSRYERTRMSGPRQRREGMPGAGGPYGGGYEREPSYDRPWEYDRPRGYDDRGRSYDRTRSYEGYRPQDRPRQYDRDDAREGEAPNETMRQPYGEGSYVQYDRLSPAVRRGGRGGRFGEGYGSRGEQGFGQYSGRGPKGYTRSPERILEDVAERLTEDPDVDASEIEVGVDGDVVVLRGKVYDRGQKRAAEDVVETVSGVRDVRNELDVEKGMLQELTDAVTGRSEDETRKSHAAPRKTRVS